VKALHLGALWAFAFVQPLFDLLGREAQFFVARGNSAGDIVLFALVFTLVPPVLLAGLVWLAGRIRPALGEGLHLALVGLLVAAILLPPFGELLGGSAFALVPALLAGAGAAALYARAAPARTFLTVLSPAPLLFLVLFLAVSPVSDLVLPSGGAEAIAGARTSRIPVVMVVFDELPATSLMDARDRVDARRYPAFASLAADSTWYRDATAVAGRTTEAVPALLTGRRPREGDLPTAADHPGSLFTLLSRSHRLEVVEPITDVCPRDLCAESRPAMTTRLRALASDLRVVSAHLLLPDDLRGGLPPIDRDWQGFAGEGRVGPGASAEQRKAFIDEVFRRLGEDDPTARFEQIIDAVDDPGARPPLLFLHTSLPHVPWRYLPDGREYAAPVAGLREGEWVGPQWQVDQSFQRHLLQTQYADRLLGRLLERLRATGLYERALVVVTADHGVSFRAGDRRRTPTPTNLHDVANMPLFIKTPGQREGRVVDGVVRTIDVLPTIARELGVRLSGVDGVPAGERGTDPATKLDVPDSWEGGTTGTYATFLRQRAERRRYERALLGAAGYDPFAIGPHPELVGRRPGAVSPGAGRLRLDGGGVWVSGTIEGLAAGTALAVTVDGRVAATTRVDASGTFGAPVPDQGRIGVLEIVPGGGFRKP
jgi:Sulfatase